MEMLLLLINVGPAGVSEVMALIGDVDKKHAILVDDMVDSGGTLCKAAEAIMNAGALSVRAYITHGIPLLVMHVKRLRRVY